MQEEYDGIDGGGHRRRARDNEQFATPEHRTSSNNRPQQQWHYQETPPAQIQRLSYAAAASSERGAEPTQSAAEFARSQFRRRDRLEKRLEELQRDVASLTLKLRASSNRSSVSAQRTPPALAEVPLTSVRTNGGGEREHLRQSRRKQQQESTTRETRQSPSPTVKIRKQRTRSNLSEHSTTPTKGRILGHASVSTMRELHKVTTERDQLRFELEKTKRTLASTERKCAEAMKAREALERLKAHCEALQESLDLSEKIRVRQKKLLQQLQLNQKVQPQQQIQSRFASPPPITRETGRQAAAGTATQARGTKKKTSAAAALGSGGLRASVSEDYSSRHLSSHQRRHRHDDAFEDDEILDSLVTRSTAGARISETNAAPQRSENLTSKPQTANTHPAYTYADFDSLLQKVHSPHPYTIRAQPTEFRSAQPNDNRLGSRPISANTSKATNRRVRSKSQGPPTSRGSAPHANNVGGSKGRTNHFLAPTQASLQRVQARRPEEQRRPFL